MTSKGLALVLIGAVAASACSGSARPESRAISPAPTAVESPTTSVGEVYAPTTVGAAPMASSEPAPVDGAESGSSTTSTTSTLLAADVPASTTTNPTESIDLTEVREALDALDALFGDLDGHIGSVDLDEGETP